jgi:hypothetical protein
MRHRDLFTGYGNGRAIAQQLLAQGDDPAGQLFSPDFDLIPAANASINRMPDYLAAILAYQKYAGAVISLGQRLLGNDNSIVAAIENHRGTDKHAGFQTMAGIIDGQFDPGLPGCLLEDRGNTQDMAREFLAGKSIGHQHNLLARLEKGVVTLCDKDHAGDRIGPMTPRAMGGWRIFFS